MLKKIFVAVIFAAIIFVGSQNNFAQAQYIYIGTTGNGWDYYAMSETFGRFAGKNLSYEATFQIITDTGKQMCISYAMIEGENQSVRYEDDQGNSGELTKDDMPMEWGLYQFLKKYYGDIK